MSRGDFWTFKPDSLQLPLWSGGGGELCVGSRESQGTIKVKGLLFEGLRPSRDEGHTLKCKHAIGRKTAW